jgi:hypothetical protein
LFNVPTVGPVAGEIADNNHLTLSGSARNSECRDEHRIEEWETMLDPNLPNRMVGRWTADAHFLNGFGMQHWKEEFAFIDVNRDQ